MKTQLLTHTDIQKAASLIKNGNVVAFPTETVYGLGASIFNEEAIRKIYTVKGRPQDNPLIAHISLTSQLSLLTSDIPQSAYILMEAFFPGPLTLVLPKHPRVPDIISAGLSSVAIRQPNHPIATALIQAVGEPLVAPSANLSGKPSPTTASHVLEDLDGNISAVIDGGPCSIGIESTVLDLTQHPIILRPGAITKEHIETVLKTPIAIISHASHDTDKVASPGMKYKHYSPNANVFVATSIEKLQSIQNTNPTQPSMILTNRDLPSELAQSVRPLSEQTLYANFREADTLRMHHIIILLDEKTLKNDGLMNRIEKAREK